MITVKKFVGNDDDVDYDVDEGGDDDEEDDNIQYPAPCLAHNGMCGR